MASDAGGTLVKVLLFGGAAFLAYRYFVGGSVLGPDVPYDGTDGRPPVAPVDPVPAGFNSLASLFGRIQTLAVAEGIATATPDTYNTLYLRAGGPSPAPDPIDVFGGRPEMSLAQYWAGMAAWLATNRGLSGLGVYAGLGRIAFAGRRGR